MTQEEEKTSDLAQLKATFIQAKNKLNRLDQPLEELTQLCEAVKHAISTNRMENEPEFAKFINEEVAIGIMQKLAKTGSFDTNVSSELRGFNLAKNAPTALTRLLTDYSAAIVCECVCGLDGGVHRYVCDGTQS